MLNRTILIGRLTKDVDLKKTSSGLSVATFTLAVNRMKDKEGNQQADFINCQCWRGTADFLAQYSRKGDMIGLEGRIQTRNYDGSDGKKVYITEIVADNVQLLSSKNTQNATREPESTQFEEFDNSPSLDISSDDLPF